MRQLLALAALILLSGCFAGEEPLYRESAGSCPFQRETTFAVTIVDADGRQASLPMLRVSPRGALCQHDVLRLDPAAQDPTAQQQQQVLYIPMQEGWWITQTRTSSSGRAGYLYGMVRLNEGRLTQYLPMCSDFTTAALDQMQISYTNPMAALGQAAGASASGANTPANLMCNPPSREKLEAAFRAWRQLGRTQQELSPLP